MEPKEGIGDRFQRETKYDRDRMEGGRLDFARQPSPYKELDGVPRVDLPDPRELAPAVTLDACIATRRSVRAFSKGPLSLEDLSYLLWASAGISGTMGNYALRTAPSAGALYPIDTYIVANRVEGLDAGVYHYRVRGHLLETVKTGDFGVAAAEAALGQRMCASSQAVFIWTAVFPRSKWKYRQRAFRYVYLDAGHVAAQLSLAAVALGLGSCQIAALYDDEVNQLVGADGTDESALYMSVVGA